MPLDVPTSLEVPLQLSVTSLVAECVASCGNECGASALWCAPKGRLFWLDTSKQELWSLDPAQGTTSTQAVTLGQGGGGLALRKDGGLVVFSERGVGMLDRGHLLDGGATLNPRIVCHPVQNQGLSVERVRLNAGRVDPQGRLVVGTCEDGEEATGGVYCVSVTLGRFWGASGQVDQLAGLGKLNTDGLAFGEGCMFLVDNGRVRRFTYDSEPSAETPATEPHLHKGKPSGACVDAEGGLWVAEQGSGRVVRIKDGAVVVEVSVPCSMVTSCTFGGRDLGTLYITTASRGDTNPSDVAGGLFACQTCGYHGLPENLFSA